jgi:uncharacterized protein YhbP (UPF0306 family)
MGIRRSRRPIARVRLEGAARRLLDASTLCAISTLSSRSAAHVSTAYFAWDERFRLIWLSDPEATHSRNIRVRRTAAVAVYSSDQRWGHPDQGIQLFGSARELSRRTAQDAERIYARRFSAYHAGALGGYRFYRFEPRRAKLFDEAIFGPGAFVTARVARRGALVWEATEFLSGEV